MELIESCLAYLPEHRPTPRALERACVQLRSQVGGEPLRFWAEEIVTACMAERVNRDPGELSNSILIQRPDGSLEPRPRPVQGDLGPDAPIAAHAEHPDAGLMGPTPSLLPPLEPAPAPSSPATAFTSERVPAPDPTEEVPLGTTAAAPSTPGHGSTPLKPSDAAPIQALGVVGAVPEPPLADIETDRGGGWPSPGPAAAEPAVPPRVPDPGLTRPIPVIAPSQRHVVTLAVAMGLAAIFGGWWLTRPTGAPYFHPVPAPPQTDGAQEILAEDLALEEPTERTQAPPEAAPEPPQKTTTPKARRQPVPPKTTADDTPDTAPATVRVKGDTTWAMLRDGDGPRRVVPGTVPPGTYDIYTSFETTGDPGVVGRITVRAGERLTLICDRRFGKCRRQ